MMKESRPEVTEKDLFQFLENIQKDGILSEKYYHILKGFYEEYKNAVSPFADIQEVNSNFLTLFMLISEQFQNPYSFAPYHEKIREPFDYYAFGRDLIRPLIDFKNSKITGWDNLEKMSAQLEKKENVVLLANHQTEVDPQLIDLMLEEKYPEIGRNMIFVAGERVVTDPNAIPFSLGCNLLCIYSKKYISHKPDLINEKRQHNTRTMKLMSELLSEGGKIIYVAPSGGRDRKDENGKITPAPFDTASVELFYLMAKKAKTPTHFYPLSLLTYDLLPPPSGIQKELGEKRIVKHCPIFFSFGDEIAMEKFSEKDFNSKAERREKRSEYIYSIILKDFEKLTKL